MTITYRELLVLYKQDILSLPAAILSEPISNETINYFKAIYKTEEIIDTMHKRWAYGRMQYDTLQYFHKKHDSYMHPVCKNAVKRHHYTFNAAQLQEDNYRPMHQIMRIAELVHKHTVFHKMSLQEVQEIIKLTQNALSDSDNQILLLEELIERIDNGEALVKTTPSSKVIDQTIRPATTSSPTITPMPHHINTKYTPQTIVKTTPSSKHPVVTKDDDNNSSGGALVQTIRQPTTSSPTITPMPHHIKTKYAPEAIDVTTIINHMSPTYMPDEDAGLTPVVVNKYTDSALEPLDRYNDTDIEHYKTTQMYSILTSDSKPQLYTTGIVVSGSVAVMSWFMSSVIGITSSIGVGALLGGLTLIMVAMLAIGCEIDLRTKLKPLRQIDENPNYEGESLFTIKHKRDTYLNSNHDSAKINRLLASKFRRLKRLYIIDDTPYFGYMFLSADDTRGDKSLALNIPENALDVDRDKSLSFEDIAAYKKFAEDNAPSDQTVIDAVFDVYYTKEKTKQSYIDKRIEVLNNNKPKIETTPYYQTMQDSIK